MRVDAGRRPAIMRSLVREKPYETVVASGKLHYWQADKPTGAVESWRLTRTVTDDRIVRVDLDARQAASGSSRLFHYIENGEGVPQRLVYRYLQPDAPSIAGNVLFGDDELINSRRDAQRHVDTAALLPLLFPTTVGLALLSRLPAGDHQIILLDLQQAGQLRSINVQLVTDDPSNGTGDDVPQAARIVQLRWQDQQRRLWLHEDGFPLQMERQDGLRAVAARFVDYRR